MSQSNYLYYIFGYLPIWPTREIVKKFLPDCFKFMFPNTKVISDCTKVRLQTPSAKVLNSQTYTKYISHTQHLKV